MTTTKISGLAVDTEYTFHLVLRTSAGTYSSEKLTVRTHKMTDLSGITVTPGVLPEPLKESLATAVERIGAKLIDQVRIDTTHFVCTEGRGTGWEKAVEMNIPVVRPEWVEGCEREGRIVGVRGYYLDENPKNRVIGPSVAGNAQPRQSATEARRLGPVQGTPTDTHPAHSRTESQARAETGEYPFPRTEDKEDKDLPPKPEEAGGSEEDSEEEFDEKKVGAEQEQRRMEVMDEVEGVDGEGLAQQEKAKEERPSEESSSAASSEREQEDKNVGRNEDASFSQVDLS